MKKEKWWVKLIRVILYGISISGVTIGVSLIERSTLSLAHADGTADAKLANGKVFLYVSAIILFVNIMWGIIRWCLRGEREKWKPGRIVGKLIGGGIWRTLAIAPLVVLSLLVFAPQVSRQVTNNLKEDDVEPISLSVREDRLRNLAENYQNMQKDEIIAELNKTFYNEFDFGTDASGNISTNDTSSWWPFGAQKAMAYSHDVTVLNKAKLSSKGNFVVFYTDTGDDKIPNETAEDLAEMLEEIIESYKKVFGFEYKYEKIVNASVTGAHLRQESKINDVLEASGIKKNITDTAMPVYVVDPYEKGSNTLASYAGKKWTELSKWVLMGINNIFQSSEQGLLYDSSPSYPFINITPRSANSESLPAVTAHELGHHYVQTHDYKESAPGSENDFVDETVPNWLSINVLPNQPEKNITNGNHYADVYLSNECYKNKISEACPGFLGYPAFAFIENYYEVVPDSVETIMNSTRHENALEYLYNYAGPELYQKVMTSLAEKTITHEYDGKITSKAYPMGEDMGSCGKLCRKNFNMSPSSTDFVWLSTERNVGNRIWFTGNEYTHASIIGRTRGERKMVIMSSGKKETDVLISQDILTIYEDIIIAVSNSSLSEESTFTVGIMLDDFQDFLKDVEEFSKSDFANLYKELQPGCFTANTDSIFDNLTGLFNLGSSFANIIEKLNPSENAGLKNGYDSATKDVKQGITTVKEALSPYEITVCTNDVNKNLSFEAAKSQLLEKGGFGFNIYNDTFGTDKISAFLDADILTESVRAYILASHSGINGLITVDITSK